MAALRLLLSMSVTFPLLIITAVVAVGDDNYHTKCFDGNGGAAAQLMRSLSKDLVDKVPGKDDPRSYCNVQTAGSGGLQMYGYAYCMADALIGDADPATACGGCLTAARDLLIDRCGGTGSGQVIGEHDHCYIWIGFGGCPNYD